MRVLLIVNDPAYGSERSYNALRLAGALARRDDVDASVFLLGDGVTCAIAGQHVPDGFYHLDRMVAVVLRHGGQVGCCGTCLDARGHTDAALVEGAHRSTLDELSDWTVVAEKVLVF